MTIEHGSEPQKSQFLRPDVLLASTISGAAICTLPGMTVIPSITIPPILTVFCGPPLYNRILVMTKMHHAIGEEANGRWQMADGSWDGRWQMAEGTAVGNRNGRQQSAEVHAAKMLYNEHAIQHPSSPVRPNIEAPGNRGL